MRCFRAKTQRERTKEIGVEIFQISSKRTALDQIAYHVLYRESWQKHFVKQDVKAYYDPYYDLHEILFFLGIFLRGIHVFSPLFLYPNYPHYKYPLFSLF